MTKDKKETCIFDFDAEQLIQLKDMRLSEVESKYYEVISRETDLKNAENSLWLNTDFKEVGCTNDKMRTAYVQSHTIDLRLKLDIARFELKQHENNLKIINDLLALRMQEVKNE